VNLILCRVPDRSFLTVRHTVYWHVSAAHVTGHYFKPCIVICFCRMH